MFTYSEAPSLYERSLVPMDDVVDEIEKTYDGFYRFAKEASFVNSLLTQAAWMTLW